MSKGPQMDDFRNHQSNLPDEDYKGLIATCIVLLGIMALGLCVGLFIGYLTFSPAKASECGTVETCVVRAEEALS
jgi:hypothetical protein